MTVRHCFGEVIEAYEVLGDSIPDVLEQLANELFDRMDLPTSVILDAHWATDEDRDPGGPPYVLIAHVTY